RSTPCRRPTRSRRSRSRSSNRSWSPPLSPRRRAARRSGTRSCARPSRRPGRRAPARPSGTSGRGRSPARLPRRARRRGRLEDVADAEIPLIDSGPGLVELPLLVDLEDELRDRLVVEAESVLDAAVGRVLREAVRHPPLRIIPFVPEERRERLALRVGKQGQHVERGLSVAAEQAPADGLIAREALRGVERVDVSDMPLGVEAFHGGSFIL